MKRRTIIKLNRNERNILQECIRRIQCFQDGNLSDKLLMLSFKTTIKTLIDKKILKLQSNYEDRCLAWSHLTNRGLQIMHQFKRKKLFCKPSDYTGNSCGIIPKTVTIYEEKSLTSSH